MTVEEINIKLVRKRKAIYHALKPYLSNKKLMQMIIIWQNKYSNQQGLAFNEFTDRVCKTEELKAIRRNIFNSLAISLQLKSEKLVHDPIDQMTEYMHLVNSNKNKASTNIQKYTSNQNDIAASDERDHKVVMFEYIFKSILNSMQKYLSLNVDVKTKLAAALNKLDINGYSKKVITDVINDKE